VLITTLQPLPPKPVCSPCYACMKVRVKISTAYLSHLSPPGGAGDQGWHNLPPTPTRIGLGSDGCIACGERRAAALGGCGMLHARPAGKWWTGLRTPLCSTRAAQNTSLQSHNHVSHPYTD